MRSVLYLAKYRAEPVFFFLYVLTLMSSETMNKGLNRFISQICDKPAVTAVWLSPLLEWRRTYLSQYSSLFVNLTRRSFNP